MKKNLDDMPKDGSPFLAVVKDWYRGGERRYHLLKMNINGYWDTAYTGDQTFEREDIIECQELPALSTAKTAGSRVMADPHQPGSPLFDGAEAYEAYLKDVCIDCDGAGRYPTGAVCKSCEGSGRVLPGDGIAAVTAGEPSTDKYDDPPHENKHGY